MRHGAFFQVGWVALVGLILGLLLATLPGIKYQAGVDEGQYLRYMSRIERGGPGAFPALFREYAEQPTQRILPNPLRAGFILVAGLWAGLFGSSFFGLTLISMVSLLLCVSLNHHFLRRYRSPPQALGIAAVIGFSPLLLALGRRALNDSFANLWMTLSFWLCFEAVRVERGRRARVCFGVAFALAVLAKEPAVLLLVPFGIFVLSEHRRRQGDLRALVADGLLLTVPVLLAVAVMICLAGGPAAFLRVVRIILASPTTNEYARKYGSGPWFRYLIDWLVLSPWTLLLAVVGTGRVIGDLRKGEAGDPLARYSALTVTFWLVPLCLFTKNVRYLALLETPLRILAVGTIREWLPAAPRVRLLAGAVVGILWCCLDWETFVRLFVLGGIYDPTTYFLISTISVIPR